MGLYCAGCRKPHDLEEAPDEGVCTGEGGCGGQLVEHDGEVGAHLAAGRAIVQAVNDGLAGVAVARGRVERGSN